MFESQKLQHYKKGCNDFLPFRVFILDSSTYLYSSNNSDLIELQYYKKENQFFCKLSNAHKARN